MKSSKYRLRRHALTLTELLVVVAIVVILAAILLPMIRPALSGQKVREASRQLSVFLTAAQARAVSTGKPAGVWIERAAHEPTGTADGDPRWYTSYRLYPAEQPAPYRGDMFDSRVVIRPAGTVGEVWGAFYAEPPAMPIPCCSSVWPALQNGQPIIRPGDLIRFEGRGKYYLITDIDDQKITFRAPFVPTNGLLSNPDPEIIKLLRVPPPDPEELPAYQPGVSFEVLRRPVKSTGTPLEMPRNTGIDLSVSGYASPFQAPLFPMAYTTERMAIIDPTLAGPARFREISPEYDIVIMFSPEGGVDQVYYISHEEPVYSTLTDIQTDDLMPFWEVPLGEISLLVARDDQIGRTPAGDLTVSNSFQNNATATQLGHATLTDTNNIWIDFSTNSGRVTTAPNGNAFADPLTGQPVPQDLTLGQYLNNARRFVKSGRSTGGR